MSAKAGALGRYRYRCKSRCSARRAMVVGTCGNRDLHYFVPPPGQTGRWRHYDFRLFIRSFNCLFFRPFVVRRRLMA